jgi:hypothetical protein
MERAVVDGKGVPSPLMQALSFVKTPFHPATTLFLSNYPLLFVIPSVAEGSVLFTGNRSGTETLSSPLSSRA